MSPLRRRPPGPPGTPAQQPNATNRPGLRLGAAAPVDRHAKPPVCGGLSGGLAHWGARREHRGGGVHQWGR